jgi:transcriptional regulator with XRE-family HTH domain
MQALSCNSLCVAPFDDGWQTVIMDSDDKNGGPNNLRAWRLHKKMTQQELADAVEPKTTANMIQYLESGERGLSLKWLRRLADAMEMTVGHLADHTPEEVQPDVLDFWAQKLDRDQKRQLAAIAEALLKTGTNDT